MLKHKCDFHDTFDLTVANIAFGKQELVPPRAPRTHTQIYHIRIFIFHGLDLVAIDN